MCKRVPLVSIGMPAYNCEKTLATAVHSILNQSYANWEMLVMEDGSTDHTLEVALSFSDPRITVYTNHSHKGLVPCLNQAVATSGGEYFTRMDADDVAYPERLERQVEYLERHSDIDLLGCSMLVFKGDGVAVGTRLVRETHQEICQRPSDGFGIGHPTWMGRTQWFRAHPYDAKAVRAEDQVLLLRSHLTSCFACLPEILCGYRENRLVLGKILRGRYAFAVAVFKGCLEREEYFNAISCALRHAAKAAVDIVALATGLNYLILAHRAGPLNPASLQRWGEVWSRAKDSRCRELPARGLLDL